MRLGKPISEEKVKLALLTVAAAATIGSAAGTADAHNLSVPHKKFSRMTTTQKVNWLRVQIHKDESVILFWRNRRWLLNHRGDIARVALRDVRWATVSRRVATRNLSKLLEVTGVGWPPHHALWTCIGRHEGSPTSVNPNGHYGLLQLHADWGYGTSHHASDDPQSVQEWAAEKAYKASHYSSSFLYGQWFNYDSAAGECMPYA